MREYMLVLTENEKGELSVSSRNDGFNPLELMGLLSWKHDDISKQIKGEITPDIIKRALIKD